MNRRWLQIGSIFGLMLSSMSVDLWSQTAVYAQAPAEQPSTAAQLLQAGIRFFEAGQPDQAFESWQKALEKYQSTDDFKGLSAVFSVMGLASSSMGEYQKSIDYYSRSLEAANQVRHARGAIIALNGLGRGFLSLGDYDAALVH